MALAPGRLVGSLAGVVLTLASVLHYRHDLQGRADARRFAERYEVAARRPVDANLILRARTFEYAAESAAEVAVADAAGGVDLSELTPDVRASWLRNAGDLDEELRDARGIIVAALRSRPGWAYHHALLGMIEYSLAARDVARAARASAWLQPLTAAVKAAPGDVRLAVYTAGAILAPPPLARPHPVPDADGILRAALRDVTFAREAFGAILAARGAGGAMSLLPDDPAVLLAASDLAGDAGEVGTAAALVRRWEQAEWGARTEDLRRIERLAELRDHRGVHSASARWVRQHDPFLFDTPASWAQAERVLALWPPVAAGWKADPRARLVSYLLKRPLSARGRDAVARTIATLSGVPPATRAHGAILAGDDYEAARIQRESGGGAAFEWSASLIAAARAHLEARDAGAARDALAALAPAARDGCDAVLVRRDLARMSGAAAPALHRRSTFGAGDWGKSSLPLCIDPDTDRVLHVTFRTGGKALVQYGFDQARLGAVVVHEGETHLAVPLQRIAGRHVFAYRTVTGPPSLPIAAQLRAGR